MKAFKDLIAKKLKEGKVLSEDDIASKKEVLKDLKDSMGSQMSDKLKGIKKVTVAADSPEGLEKGLEMAEEVVEGSEDMGESIGDDENESVDREEEAPLGLSEDSMEDEMSEEVEMTEEEIDAKLAELMAKKEALRG